ncbi:MAG: threonine ammonia-lyase [Gemmatimonadota bacterium]
MPTLVDILSARERIGAGIVHTPCIPALAFGDLLPCPLHLKLENLQRTGSFKDRGALNRLLDLSAEQKQRGVVTASAGNHAQAVAYHCGRLGIAVTVVMPEATPLIKLANTRRYGAQISLYGQTVSDAMIEAQRLAAADGLTLVHPFDDDQVIAGQGTIGAELLEQLPDLTTVLVPIGGGGLISGIAIALKELRPDVRVIGVEADAAASALASREAGRIVHIETSETMADGIAVKRLGERTFPVIEKLVDQIVTVAEEEIAAAVHLLIERQKIVAEGAGAACLAALAAGKVGFRPADVAVLIVSGGNIDVNIIERVIERGLVKEGRIAHLMVKMRDRPGSLARLTRMVAEAGANVLEISHRRAFADVSVAEVEIVVHLETRGREHVVEIIRLLESAGLHVEEDV